MRLTEKGLLAREAGQRGVRHTYFPLLDERTFVANAIKQLLTCVACDYPEALSV